MPSTEQISLITSAIALFGTAITFYLNFLRKSPVVPVRPPQIYIGVDSPSSQKVMLPSWLLHTQQRSGHAIESMYAVVQQTSKKHALELWVIGREDFDIGGGLMVNSSGFITAHHFMPLDSKRSLVFTPGACKISVYAKIASWGGVQELLNQDLTISSEHAALLAKGDRAIMYNWSPIEGKYIPSEVEPEPLPESKNSSFLLRLKTFNPFSSPVARTASPVVSS